jgi:hypothetical protein
MVDFSYYDTLSNLIPGCIFLWGLSFFGPLANGTGLLIFLTGNEIVDTVLFLIVAYFVGHVLQFFSKLIIEPLIKKTFWEGHFFSEIFLLGPMKKIEPELLVNVINYAEKNLNLPRDKLTLLNDNEILTNEIKKKEAMRLSNLIYRIIDAKLSDTTKGQKAQLQNTFYSFFRNFSMCFLALLLCDIGFVVMRIMIINFRNIFSLLVIVLMSIIFLYQAKQRAELYVKGLFWANVYN